MDLWSGSIRLDDGTKIEDINIVSQSSEDSVSVVSSSASLDFLAVVRVSELPLSLVAGPSHTVWTRNEKSTQWFSQILLLEPPNTVDVPSTSWFDLSKESYAGVLTKVTATPGAGNVGSVTDLLFYGVVNDGLSSNEADSILQVRVLPLSTSQVENLRSNQTPPISRDTSPQLDGKGVIYGHFIDKGTAVKPQQSRKRPATSDIFDAANELRRRIKGSGGAGISQAAAALSQTHPSHSGQKLSHDVSNADGRKRVQPDQKPLSAGPFSATFTNFSERRGLTRTPSLSVSAKPRDIFGVDRRKIERTKSLPSNPAPGSLEQLNRDAVSNLILKGMRVYGFQPRKKPEKDVESLLADTSSQAQPADDEYKLVYHQTFKAAVFAFRKTISSSALYQHGDILRETVDNLLSIFCTAPILDD